MILAIPSPLGVALGIATAAAYGFTAAASSWLSRSSTQSLLVLAWLLHAFALGCGLVGGTPRFGFAPAISVTAWLVLTVYAIESSLYPQLKVRRALAVLGAVAVMLAVLLPGTPLHVSASPWLPLHLALGIASYGLFGAAVVHAWLMTRTEKQMRVVTDAPTGLPLLTLERLTFRFITAGFVLLYPDDPDVGAGPQHVRLSTQATVPALRGRGVGTALTEHAQRWAETAGYAAVATDWRVPNLQSSRFWPARGFRPTFHRLHRVLGVG